ncbi:hypothetical protein KA107_00880 [Candidatus Pacearchaeota archaeon]|nr:hypothetical protein [Candidatus Pacearchaeota archaeon]
MNSLAHKSPIVEGILLNVFSKFPSNIKRNEKHVLNTDIVPRIHEIIVERNDLQESVIHSKKEPVIISQEVSPVQPVITFQSTNRPKKFVQQTQTLKTNFSNLPSAKPWESYRRIFPILKDPLVTHIECKGPNIPIAVVKGGRNQLTNVTLTREEIDEYLNSISEKTRLPLVEGVFHVLVDNYYLNAILSNSIEPSFIIKKNFSSTTF